MVAGGGRPDRAALERMADALGHRGPDDQGIWADALGRCVLGHRRLSIIDTSEAGRQQFKREGDMSSSQCLGLMSPCFLEQTEGNKSSCPCYLNLWSAKRNKLYNLFTKL